MYSFVNGHYVLSCIYFISKTNIEIIFCGYVTRGYMFLGITADIPVTAEDTK